MSCENISVSLFAVPGNDNGNAQDTTRNKTTKSDNCDDSLNDSCCNNLPHSYSIAWDGL